MELLTLISLFKMKMYTKDGTISHGKTKQTGKDIVIIDSMVIKQALV